MKLKDRGFFLITVLVVFLSVPSLLKSQITITIPNRNGTRGATVEVPVQIQGISVGDSVLAYQMTIWFDSSILQAVGANSQGTMTEFWGETYVGPKTDTVRVGAFTTNEPGTRLVPDAGILVKLEFLVIGEIGTSTQIRIVDKKIFNKDGEMTVANTTDGLLTVTAGSTVTAVDITLHPDWNLASFPIIADNNTIPDVFDNLQIERVISYFFGEGAKSWDKQRYDLGFYNDLQSLDGIHGYWVLSYSSVQEIWHISGNTITSTTPIPFYSGWNLVGYLPQTDYSIAHAFQSLDTLYSRVLKYEGGGVGYTTWDRLRENLGYYNDLQRLFPNFGYWVMMDSARTLEYPSGGLQSSKLIAKYYHSTVNQDSIIITPWVCDFYGRQEDILSEGDTVEAFDSDGILCGRTLVVSGSMFTVHVYGDDPSTTEIDEGSVNGDTVQFKINGNSAIVINGNNIWTDKGSEYVELSLESSEVFNHQMSVQPQSVSILQNFPNPFNARTNISYKVNLPCHVTMNIYDATGKMVRELMANRFQTPGQYRIQWDGRSGEGNRVSSGVYVCRIQAGKIRYSIKMVLLF